ncbi:SRPBCC family protein [Paenibacillus sp. WLX1005]|uniref:SRPBCC family protein n=1 Tax=Paenibacillus sp. WLX1005 TaxID=3243766 RepID=UPI003983DCD7
MPIIVHEIYIEASIQRCFDLARNVDIHTQTTASTGEKAVAGKTSGYLENGDEVTWEAVHFGIKQQLTAKIIQMHPPHVFVDIMVKGAFHSFKHTHEFVEQGTGTIMKDYFEYKSPLGVLGRIADHLFLKSYMTRFLILRAKELKVLAEYTVNRKDIE